MPQPPSTKKTWPQSIDSPTSATIQNKPSANSHNPTPPSILPTSSPVSKKAVSRDKAKSIS